jgi:hypothetical protein
MALIFPRPFLLGEMRVPLTQEVQYWTRTVPAGASWRLRYLLVDYLPVDGDGIQNSQNLSYRLYDGEGLAFQVDPVQLDMVTSPAGLAGLAGTNPIDVEYRGGSTVKLEIHGQVIGLGPDYISITMFGIRGWGRVGGR